MPNCEAGVSLWAAVSFWKLHSWIAPMKGTEPLQLTLDFHCQHPWAFRDNPSFLFSFLCPSCGNTLCSVEKDQEATTAYTGLTQLPDQTHMWNSEKGSSAQRKGDRGVWLCKVGHHSGDACSEDVHTTYISSPCWMFDVISGTTAGLNITKIDLLV